MPDGGTTMFMSSPGSMPTSWYQWSQWSPQNIGHNSDVNVQQQINTFPGTKEGINDYDQKSKHRYRKTSSNSNSSRIGNVNRSLSHDKRKTVTNHNENRSRKYATNYGTGNGKITSPHNTGIRNIKSHHIMGNRIKNTINNPKIVKDHGSSFDSGKNALPDYQHSSEIKKDENVQLGAMKQE